MTRKEEISQMAEVCAHKEAIGEENRLMTYQDFINGAEQDDKIMVEKIWQWLKAHIKIETVTYSDVWDMSVVDILATDFTTVDEMEESFRKIIEE